MCTGDGYTRSSMGALYDGIEMVKKRSDWKVVVCIQVNFSHDNPPEGEDLYAFLNSVDVQLGSAPANVELISVDPFNSIDGQLEDGTYQIGIENSVVLAYDYENVNESEVKTKVLKDLQQTQFSFTKPIEGVDYYISQMYYWAFYDLNNPSEEEIDTDLIDIYQFDENTYPNIVIDEENDDDFEGITEQWAFNKDGFPYF